MTWATLTHAGKSGERAATHAAANVAFTSRVAEGAVAALGGFIEDGVLNSRHEKVFQKTIGAALAARVELTRDNPHLTEEQRAALDDRGVTRPGVRVRAGDVLWSAVRYPLNFPRKPKKPRADEDDSQRVPPLWDGALVADVQCRVGKSGTEVSVTLERELPLQVGDALYLEDQFLGVLSQILDDEEAAAWGLEGDMFVSRETAERLRRSEQTLYGAPVAKSEQVAAMHALPRRGKPFTLITQQPLNLEQAPAQTISQRHARWLWERGLENLLGEFASLKSDDLAARQSLEDYAQGKLPRKEIPAPQAPLSLWLVQAKLMAMGLRPTIEGGNAPTLTLRPATREELLAASQGQVRKPDTLNYRTFESEPDGLFCPTIFNDQFTRFGHVELAAPVVPYWWRRGSPSVLEQLLPLTAKQIEALVRCRECVRLDGGGLEWGENTRAFDDPETWLTGGAAIRRLLQTRAPAKLPAGLPCGADVLTPDVLLVLPAPMRPIVALDSGNFATSDLNDLYRRVINRNNRVAKLAELQAPPVILQNEQRMLQVAFDTLFANGLLSKSSQVLDANDRALWSLGEFCLKHFAEPMTKRVGWSAQARAVIDDNLPPGHVVVPRAIYDDLLLSAQAPVLLTLSDGEALVALSPKPEDAAVVRLPRRAAETLAWPTTHDAFISLHAPLRTAAVEEARRLQRGELTLRQTRPSASWLDARGDLADLLVRMAHAALIQEPAPLNTPQMLLLAGVGSGEFQEQHDHRP